MHVHGRVLAGVCLYAHVCTLVYEQVSRDFVQIIVSEDLPIESL